jgi:hypothetical protein
LRCKLVTDADTFPLFALKITGRSLRLRADADVVAGPAGGGAVDTVVEDEGKESAVQIGALDSKPVTDVVGDGDAATPESAKVVDDELICEVREEAVCGIPKPKTVGPNLAPNKLPVLPVPGPAVHR